MKIALYESARDVRSSPLDVTWEELAELLSDFPEPACSADSCAGKDCPAKDREAWSPVDIDGPRANANVRAVTAAVFDLDGVTRAEMAALEAALAGLAWATHTTHSHSAALGSYRLALRLDRPCLPGEWPRVRRALVEALGIPADPAVKDLSRFYFLPTRRAGAPFEARRGEGAAASVDEALEVAWEPPYSGAERPPSSAILPVDRAGYRARAEAARRQKAGGSEREREQAEILRRALAGEPLAPRGQRGMTLLRAAGLLAYLPGEASWEAAAELLGPSVEAMDRSPAPEAPGGDWLGEYVRPRYEAAARAREGREARRAADAAAVRELVGRRGRAAPNPADPDDGWQERLILGRGEARACEHNADLILSAAPELRGALRWNEVSKQVEVRSGPLAGVAREDLAGAAAGWLQREYEFFGSAQMVGAALLRVARLSPYDPVKEYLEECAWDGRPRLDSFFEEYLGAEGTPYVRSVSRRWLVGLVARAMDPGCKHDTVLILEGPQGAGKSQALEALVGRENFLDTALTLGDKDAMLAIAGAWLVELGELASFKRAESNKVKQFITSRTDKYRPPYAAVTVESPRRCVLCGTTNDRVYLTDQTGNRRYLPVRVGRVRPDLIRRDRDMVLAEAVAAWAAGERWWHEDGEAAAAAQEVLARLDVEPHAAAVERWWYGMEPARRPREVAQLDVAEMALKLPVDRVTHSVRVALGRAMSDLGFERRRRMQSGATSWYYTATEAMMTEGARATAARQAGLQLLADVRKAAKKDGEESAR